MTPNHAKCPACGQEVTFVPTPDGDHCPKCGAPRLSDGPVPKFNWIVFLGVLLAPALLALLAALGKLEGLAVASPLIGGLAAGLFCGLYLARRVGRKVGILDHTVRNGGRARFRRLCSSCVWASPNA